MLHLAAIACLTIGGYMGFALIAPQVLMTGTGMERRACRLSHQLRWSDDRDRNACVGWHSDRPEPLRASFIGSMVAVAACVCSMAFASTPAILIVAYLAMSFFWPGGDAFDQPRRDRSRAVPNGRRSRGRDNTLAQLGAFVRPCHLGDQQGLDRDRTAWDWR